MFPKILNSESSCLLKPQVTEGLAYSSLLPSFLSRSLHTPEFDGLCEL